MSEDREELLLAYLDGELEGAELARAEQLIKGDAEARAFVERHRMLGDQLRQAFQTPMEEEVPERLLQPFAEQTEERTSETVVAFPANRRQAAPRRWTELAMAASIALCVGGVVGLSLDLGPGGLESSRPLHVAGAIDREGRLHQVLEQTASFETVSWSDGQAHEATAIPLMSFRTEDGQFCREYEMLVSFQGSVSSTIAIACRGADQGWTDEILVVSKQSDDAGEQGGYEAASGAGQAALDGFIAEIMQGDTLSEAEERRLIEDGWR